MHHQLHSCEGSINLQKDGEELLHKTREPTTSSAREEAGGARWGGHFSGAVYMCGRCIQASPVRLFHYFYFCHRYGALWGAVRRRGEWLRLLCCLGRPETRDRGRKERKKYEADPQLTTVHFVPFLSALSTKVCLIHKGLIAITAAATAPVLREVVLIHPLQEGRRP